MGIPGIFKLLGPAERVSLCKLATDHIEQTGRPLRVAIDFAIWHFQTQSARGGSNPAIRTLFYRILRLLSLSIQPVFVFDGPHKPLFKRNKKSSCSNGATTTNNMAKHLIRLFGLQAHDAPGEAEAECALLQLNGVVDAVLSEDADTLMFGCTKMLKKPPKNGAKELPALTQVELYDTDKMKRNEVGLDREGMVLVALMSGGDYIPEGVPGCGPQVAYQAARAGFGKSLCGLKRSDKAGLSEWKANLEHELRTNESGFFRTKHKALIIPEDFPNLEVLRYYTHPVVSSADSIEALRTRLAAPGTVEIEGLREFSIETFDWAYEGGAIKFITVLAPSLLLHALQGGRLSSHDCLGPSSLIESIGTVRRHASTDGTEEFRVSYIPNEVVRLNLELEEQAPPSSTCRQGLALNSDDEFDEHGDTNEVSSSARIYKPFDPLHKELVWVPSAVMERYAPTAVERWHGSQAMKTRTKSTAKRTGVLHKTTKPSKTLPDSSLDTYLRVTKNIGPPLSTCASYSPSITGLPSSQQARLLSSFSTSRVQIPPIQASNTRSKPPPSKPSQRATKRTTPALPSSPLKSQPPPSSPALPEINPWTIASSQTSPSRKVGTPAAASKGHSVSAPILLSSSPCGAPCSPVASKMTTTTTMMKNKMAVGSPRTQRQGPVTINLDSSPLAPPEERKRSSPEAGRSSGYKRSQTGISARSTKAGQSSVGNKLLTMKDFGRVTKPTARTPRTVPHPTSKKPNSLDDPYDGHDSQHSDEPSDYPSHPWRQSWTLDAYMGSPARANLDPMVNILVPYSPLGGRLEVRSVDRAKADEARDDPNAMARLLGVNLGRARRAFRESEASFLDLTGGD